MQYATNNVSNIHWAYKNCKRNKFLYIMSKTTNASHLIM
jgi:hypothetical protein